MILFFEKSKIESSKSLLVHQIELNKCEFNNSFIYNNTLFSGSFGFTNKIGLRIIDSKIMDTEVISKSRDLGGIYFNNSIIEKSSISVGYDSANILFSDCQIDDSKFVNLGSDAFLDIEKSSLTNTSIFQILGYLTISESQLLNPQSDTTPYHINVDRAQQLNLINSTFESNLSFNSNGIDKLNGLYLNETQEVKIFNSVFKGYKDIITAIGMTSFVQLNGNYFLDYQGFALKNQSQNDINARENYWDTTDSLQIAEKVYDNFDNSFGIVDFGAYLTNSPSSNSLEKPTNLFKGQRENGVFLQWNKNQENEVAGYKIYSRQNFEDEFELFADVGPDTTFFSETLLFTNQVTVSAYTQEADGIFDISEGNESITSNFAIPFYEATLTSDNLLCEDELIEISLNRNTVLDIEKKYILQLSDTTGSFENAITLDSLNQDGTGFKTPLPSYIESGKTYSIRIKSTELELISEIFSVTPIKFPKNTLTIANSSCRGDTINLSINEFSPSTLITWELDSGFILENVGDTSFTVVFQSPGLKNTKLIIDYNGCVTDTSFSNNVLSTPSKPEICIVTVDETTNKNKIVWTHNSDLIKTYAIYRETNVADEYLLVDKVEAYETLSYTDEQSFPDQISNRYKISAIDNCEYETSLSNSHQTIHLTINKGLNNS